MNLIVLHEAEIEFSESVTYYEKKEEGLGARFRNEVAAATHWIEENPNVPRLRNKGYRRVNLRTFSHYLTYIVRGDTIWIVAIAHAHRRPEFWLNRI